MISTAFFRLTSTGESLACSWVVQDTVEQDISWLRVAMSGLDGEALISSTRLVDLVITSAQLEATALCRPDPVSSCNLARTAVVLTLLAKSRLALIYKVIVSAEVYVRQRVARS